MVSRSPTPFRIQRNSVFILIHELLRALTSGSWWTAWFVNDCLSSIYIRGAENRPGASNAPVRTRTVASEPPSWHTINNQNKTLQSVAISRHLCWIAINCTEMNVSVIIGSCASVFFFFFPQLKPRSTLRCYNAAGPGPRAQRYASGPSTVMRCRAEGLAGWQEG